MPEQQRNYYVLCDDNCRFPGMTSEQIIAAIAEATGETPVHIDDAFITKIKEQNHNGALKWWVGTEAQYNAIQTKDAETLYIITDKELLDDEIVDNLTSEATDKALSAKQGKVLNDKCIGTEQKTLLWTNASPTSAFAAQTIPLDLSAYEAIEIESNFAADTSLYRTYKLYKETLGYIVMVSMSDTNNYRYELARRTFSITDSSITISNCIYNSVTNLWLTNNVKNIPFKIYGIKVVA